MSENNIENKLSKSNYKWTIGCLSAGIVFLVAFILFDKASTESQIIGYLSFASLLLSILLSIFAILFSYYSSGQIDSKLGQMEDAVSKIEKSNESLSSSYTSFIESLLLIREKLGSIDAKQQYGGEQNKNFQQIDAYPKVSNPPSSSKQDTETD